MTLPSIQLLRNALLEPTGLDRLPPEDWDLLIRQGRHTSLLARMALTCEEHRMIDRIPAQPGMHLESAAKIARRQHRELAWEVEQIDAALKPVGIQPVLLKGAAYAMAGLDAAKGRMVSDVDILVPYQNLGAVESELMKNGWISTVRDTYDQHYYRTWSHELPPMRHVRRGTVIDVHHAILPRSARLHPDSDKLLANAIAITPSGSIKVLAPEDMLLHSATHLFHEGELERGFRDIVDLDSLLRQFGTAEGYWDRLVSRACELDLSRPLFYALRYTKEILGTNVPESAMNAVRVAPGGRPEGLFLSFMDALFLRALRPAHATTSDAYTPLARWLLYVRSHWIRMPPWLLLPHLARKALAGLKKPDA